MRNMAGQNNGITKFRLNVYTAVVLILGLGIVPAHAQFGRNKISYLQFDWHVYKSPHFDVHYYPEIEPFLEEIVSYAESAYLKRLVERLRQGDFDDELVLRKAMRKPPEAYTSTSPPHVVAARKMSRRPGWLVSYVITTAGPEPAAEQKHPLDHEHYVTRQIRAVAEPVLDLLGLRFEKVIGDDRQLDLF